VLTKQTSKENKVSTGFIVKHKHCTVHGMLEVNEQTNNKNNASNY